MDIHEYQAKEILSEFGVPVPRGGLAYSPEQAAYRAREIGGERWVVKAQIHAGGRGKAGGIKLCRDEHQVWDAADELLGKRLVTHQTGPRGKVVYRLYVEAASEIAKEFYLGLVLDRKSERLMVVASSAGGMEIEDISHDRPETLIRLSVDPAVGMQPFQAREIAFDLGFEAKQVAKVVETLLGCYRAFREMDATMVEINPLVLTADGQLLALDAKMSFDDNALFRRPHISELRDKSQEDPRETRATDRGLSYVGLDGSIGCIINGAGLAMFRSFPLFRLVIDEVEKTLPLVDLAIARRFAGLVPDPEVRDDIFGMIEAEYGRTVARLLRVTGEKALLDRFPNHRSRLDSRLPMLNRASRQQVELLRRVRSRRPGGDAGEDFVPLLLSINCVAAGLGWTG